MPVPTLSPSQRRAAGAKAVAARRRRAEMRADLKAGRIGLGAVLDIAATDEAIGGMRVRDLIGALPRYGPRRSAAAMTLLRIAANRRVRGLGSAQREALRSLARSPS